MINFLRLHRDPAPGGDGGGVPTILTPGPIGTPAGSASGSVTLPPAGDGTPKPPVTPPAFVIPDLYKDKPYLKGVDSLDKALAMLDGAETKLGQRPAGIPADNASPEEWQKFWTALGRPETPDKYQFDYGKDDKGQPKAPADPKWDSALKQMLHEEGITVKQAAGLDKKFQGLVAQILKEKGIADQQLNVDFDKIGSDVYGAERDKVIARVVPLIKEFTHSKLQPGIAKLSSEALMIMSSAIEGMRAKFIQPEGAPLNLAGGAPSGSADSLRAEARSLMNSPAYTNAFDPAHEQVQAKINELYQRASQMK